MHLLWKIRCKYSIVFHPSNTHGMYITSRLKGFTFYNHHFWIFLGIHSVNFQGCNLPLPTQDALRVPERLRSLSAVQRCSMRQKAYEDGSPGSGRFFAFSLFSRTWNLGCDEVMFMNYNCFRDKYVVKLYLIVLHSLSRWMIISCVIWSSRKEGELETISFGIVL